MKKKIAVVLFNLGGPNNIKEVRKFLFSLFYDKNILTIPNPFRYLLAKFISITRANKSKNLYKFMGGKSPICEYTENQANLLQLKLADLDPKNNYKVFVSMRHSFPRSDEVKKQINYYQPEEVILLPLYPQYSTSTSKSSFEDFIPLMEDVDAYVKKICCYPIEENFIKSHQSLIRKVYQDNKLEGKKNIILFSAHSIPQKFVDKGDPYQWQVNASVEAIMKNLNLDVEYKVCYQSKVGRIKWLEPETQEEIKKAALQKKSIILVPIAFVGEHLETLVELDIEYKELAMEYGLRDYYRVPALDVEKNFILSLATSVIKRVENIVSRRLCPREFCKCGYGND